MKHRSPVVCLAFCGGLDTTYCAAAARRDLPGGTAPRRVRSAITRTRAKIDRVGAKS